MADKTSGPGHAMFGPDDQAHRRADYESSTAPSLGTPQSVYVQGQTPAPARHGGKLLPILVGFLLVISVVNLVLNLTARSRFSDALSEQNDEVVLLNHRMDSCDQGYAQLSGQFAVTSEKLRLTQEELARARSLAAEAQKQQKAAVRQLSQAIKKGALNDPSIYPIF